MKYKINLDLTSKYTLTLKLFENVKNMKEIKEKITGGNFQCGLIKPSRILDPFQVAVAANKAVTSDIITRTLYTEILFNLSLSSNISSSLKTFGASEEDTDLLVAILAKEDEENDVLFDDIDGEEVDVFKLSQICDIKLIKKEYKITEAELLNNSLLDVIVSKIAVKDVVQQ
ncbi:unnamed protein product [Brassicogethes aeneus]|uniref:TP53RK-binding protein n=1 Tax=Brassicogethes aeneus TaxID=1431903 RepID=A0A9P0BHV5_BRAAE|nr:unnamed protein product [Brassicogethes aeneus]